MKQFIMKKLKKNILLFIQAVVVIAFISVSNSSEITKNTVGNVMMTVEVKVNEKCRLKVNLHPKGVSIIVTTGEDFTDKITIAAEKENANIKIKFFKVNLTLCFRMNLMWIVVFAKKLKKKMKDLHKKWKIFRRQRQRKNRQRRMQG